MRDSFPGDGPAKSGDKWFARLLAMLRVPGDGPTKSGGVPFDEATAWAYAKAMDAIEARWFAMPDARHGLRAEVERLAEVEGLPEHFGARFAALRHRCVDEVGRFEIALSEAEFYRPPYRGMELHMGAPSWVTSAVWSADGRRVALGFEGVLHVVDIGKYDFRVSEPMAVESYGQGPAPVLAISSDGASVVRVRGPETLHIYTQDRSGWTPRKVKVVSNAGADAGAHSKTKPQGNPDPARIPRAARFVGGSRLAVVWGDGAVDVYDLPGDDVYDLPGDCASTEPPTPYSAPAAVVVRVLPAAAPDCWHRWALSFNGIWYCCVRDNAIEVWDLRCGERSYRREVPVEAGAAEALAITEDGGRVACLCTDRRGASAAVRSVWILGDDGARAAGEVPWIRGNNPQIAWSPDGGLLAVVDVAVPGPAITQFWPAVYDLRAASWSSLSASPVRRRQFRVESVHWSWRPGSDQLIGLFATIPQRITVGPTPFVIDCVEQDAAVVGVVFAPKVTLARDAWIDIGRRDSKPRASNVGDDAAKVSGCGRFVAVLQGSFIRVFETAGRLEIAFVAVPAASCADAARAEEPPRGESPVVRFAFSRAGYRIYLAVGSQCFAWDFLESTEPVPFTGHDQSDRRGDLDMAAEFDALAASAISSDGSGMVAVYGALLDGSRLQLLDSRTSDKYYRAVSCWKLNCWNLCVAAVAAHNVGVLDGAGSVESTWHPYGPRGEAWCREVRARVFSSPVPCQGGFEKSAARGFAFAHEVSWLSGPRTLDLALTCDPVPPTEPPAA